MKRLLLLFFFTATLLTAGYSQSLLQGIVFDDANGNSVFDADEKGIPGVGVSNGTEVVQTDRDGRYVLPVSDPMIVFVIKPSGYRSPLNDLQLPEFYYIHKPEGSPALKYPGSAPTGPLPERVDFPLVKYDEPERFNMVLFGDTQPYSETEIDYLRRSTINRLIGIDSIAFGTTLGDITGDRPDFFEPVSRAIAGIGVPWYHVIGNHDHNFDTDHDRTASEAYEAFYGPATYSFNYGKVHFIVFDNIIHSLNEQGRARYTGGLREEQLRFVENDLRQVSADHLVVLLMHIPLFDEGGETFRHSDRDRLFATLSKFPHTLSLSGHTHYIKQYFFDGSEGWKGEKPHHHFNMGAICGDWWKGVVDQYDLPGAMMRDGSPQGYFILRFDGNQYIYDYQTIHYDLPRQISLYRQGDVLYANFFAGNRFSTLQYRLGGGEWLPMEMTLESDPLFTSIRRRWDETPTLPGKIPSRPVVSEHLWKADLSTPGSTIVEVRATDMYGRTFTEKMLMDE